MIDNGFLNIDNYGAGFLIEYENDLYAITENWVGGAQIWRSDNGLDWSLLGIPGFGDSNNEKVWSGAVYNDEFYLGSVNWGNGGEIWRYEPLEYIYVPIVKR